MSLEDLDLYDPRTEKGVERIEYLKEILTRILKNVVNENERLRERGVVRALDVCCGMGVSSIALVRAIKALGLGVQLVVLDRNPDFVEKARRYVAEELGREPRALALDALEIAKLGEEFDVVLMAGFSSVHFDPWRMARLCVNVAQVLDLGGAFIVEDIDRLYSYVSRGVRRVDLLKLSNYRATLVLHKLGDYDRYRATVGLNLLEIPTGRFERVEVHPWSLGGLAALLWIFFSRIELVEEDEIFYLVASRPRKKVVEELVNEELPSWLPPPNEQTNAKTNC